MTETTDAPVLEVCCGSALFALEAAAAGAGRVELCDNLVEGGTTPSAGAIDVAVRRLRIPVMVMIRPRGGDFLYRGAEVDVMLADIEEARRRGAHGVVFGALSADGAVDRAITEELVAAARPLPVTFHRAFDLSRNLDESLDVLMEIGVDRVLTSAGCASVVEGLETLARLTARAGNALRVLPGGGIRADNVARVLDVPGVREIHLGASRRVASGMTYRVEGVPMGGAYEPDEYLVEVADVERVSGVAATMALEVRAS
jgi:copper homeostasis protein